eukprot:TRINITY_DN5017_c0_g1_i1.p1 TRINITY_DN5017_c0_g1~~TRINITY_DN5017_c0_g1_i1.p1  ORF type:complete len:194 (-),score=14.80 TRINITY_DN5017_c0_g1_i1:48-629(-)
MQIGISVDAVESAHIFNLYAHNSYCECHRCTIVGKNSINRRYFYRFSKQTFPYSAIVTRRFREIVLTRIGTSKETFQFQGNSEYVDNLLSFFPLSVCFADHLHVVWGVIDYTLFFKLILKHHPKKYEKLVEVTRNLKIPREEESHYNLYLGGKMNAKGLKKTKTKFKKNYFYKIDMSKIYNFVSGYKIFTNKF